MRKPWFGHASKLALQLSPLLLQLSAHSSKSSISLVSTVPVLIPTLIQDRRRPLATYRVTIWVIYRIRTTEQIIQRISARQARGIPARKVFSNIIRKGGVSISKRISWSVTRLGLRWKAKHQDRLVLFL